MVASFAFAALVIFGGGMGTGANTDSAPELDLTLDGAALTEGVGSAVRGDENDGGGGSGSEESALLGMREVAGLLVALSSAMFLAFYMQLLKETKAYLTEARVMTLMNSVIIVPALIGSLALERDDDGAAWGEPIAELSVHGWLMLTSFAVGVYFAANVVQQVRGMRPLGVPCAALASGLGTPRPCHNCLRRDSAPPCHICAGTRAHRSHIRTGTGARPSHICAGT
jgi:hypothetical protein